MANWYVNSVAIGANNGTSYNDAWTSFASINQTSLTGGDIVYVYPGSGFYAERYTLSKGGISTGQRITYKGVSTGSLMPAAKGFNGTDKNFIAVIGMEFYQPFTGGIVDAFACIQLQASTGWLIQDCYAHDTYGNGFVSASTRPYNDLNIVRCNRFDYIGIVSGGKGIDNGMIGIYGKQNLFEYNTFGAGMDRTRSAGSGLIIRNNYDTGTNEDYFTNSVPFPYHTDTVQGFHGNPNPQKHLVECNFVKDNVSLSHNAHFYIMQDASTGLVNGNAATGLSGLNWFVIRRNTVIRVGEAFALFNNLSGVYVHNNTASAMQNNASQAGSAIGFDSAGGYGFDLRNNSFVNSPLTYGATNQYQYVGTKRPSGFTSDYNHVYIAGRMPTGTTYSSIHNLGGGGTGTDVFPFFLDSGNDNFALLSNSPLIGSGGGNTQASGAGTNSNVLYVSGAAPLCDGWGIVEPDLVKIGTGNYVRISGINYPTNQVILQSPYSWSDGDLVYIKGSDTVGSVPYPFATGLNITNTTSYPLISGTNILSATTTTPDAIRKIEFLIDGIPMGHVCDAPYQINVTHTGGSPSIEARAYNMWASPILTLSSYASATGNNTNAIRFKRLGAHPKFSVLTPY